jgi:ketosteroid isomerase-like protein
MDKVALIATMLFAVLTASSGALAQSAGMEQVKAANQSYYAALSALDMTAMEKVWSRGPDDTNIAPPTRPVVSHGWDAVKKAYQGFWGTLDKITVAMEQPTINIHGSVAWVYGIEKAQRKLKNGQDQTGSNFGTSIFVNEAGQWLMVFHQAAAIPQ